MKGGSSMAIVKANETRSASCRFITGVDGDGKEQYLTRTIANFKTDSILDDVFDVVLAIAGLYPYSTKNVNISERCELVEGY